MESKQLLLVVFCLYWSKAVNSKQCVNQCTVVDDSIEECWPHSLDYYGTKLLDAANEFSSVLMHVQRWKIRHPSDKYEEFEKTATDKIMMQYVSDAGRYENGPLNENMVRRLFAVILNETNAINQERNVDESHYLPRYSCPIPCDYYPKVWMGLFFITFAALILACATFAMYYYMHMRNAVISSQNYALVDQRNSFS